MCKKETVITKPGNYKTCMRIIGTGQLSFWDIFKVATLSKECKSWKRENLWITHEIRKENMM